MGKPVVAGIGGYAINGHKSTSSDGAIVPAATAAGDREHVNPPWTGDRKPVYPPSDYRESPSELSYRKPDSPQVLFDEMVAFLIVILPPLTFSVGRLVLRKDSVLMVQVAFDGAIDQIQGDLDSMSLVMDSETQRGLRSILSETAARVLSYPQSCFGAYSNVNIKGWFQESWIDCFDETYMKERKKVHDRKEKFRGERDTPADKYLIVTILVGATGRHALPAINSLSDLDSALCYLTSINPLDLEAVKVFWSSRNDVEDFPLRRFESSD